MRATRSSGMNLRSGRVLGQPVTPKPRTPTPPPKVFEPPRIIRQTNLDDVESLSDGENITPPTYDSGWVGRINLPALREARMQTDQNVIQALEHGFSRPDLLITLHKGMCHTMDDVLTCYFDLCSNYAHHWSWNMIAPMSVCIDDLKDAMEMCIQKNCICDECGMAPDDTLNRSAKTSAYVMDLRMVMKKRSRVHNAVEERLIICQDCRMDITRHGNNTLKLLRPPLTTPTFKTISTQTA